MDADGRGRSIWDTFSHQPGRILDGSNGDVACDHYHRWPEDVRLMAELGLTGYRFSVAWSRIQPDGAGPANPAGIAFYDRLIDALLERGISPMLTLFHWDLPQALQDAGGWLNRDTTARFAEYADILGQHFADRVDYWMPVNEPNVFTFFGHALGNHAPGSQLGLDALPVAHHLLLGHGRAVQALRAHGARRVGAATNHSPIWPASERPADVEAAAGYDDLWNRLFADPMLLGSYPQRYAERLGAFADDLPTISQPLDFYGMNYYNPVRIAAAEAGSRTGFTAGRVGLPAAADRGLPADRLRLAGDPGRPDRGAFPAGDPVPGPAAAGDHHRERLQLRRRARPGRQGA